MVYGHVTGLSVAQGHINRKILEILEASDVKPSRREKKRLVCPQFCINKRKSSSSDLRQKLDTVKVRKRKEMRRRQEVSLS